MSELHEFNKQQRAKAAISVAFMPAYRALEAAIEELDMDWTAHNPVQGERATKVLAWQAMEAAITPLEEVGYLTTPEPDYV